MMKSNLEDKYFINKWYDNIFIIFPPLYCILAIVFYQDFDFEHIFFWYIVQGFAATTTMYRAYLNLEVLKKFWFRLLVVPFILWGMMLYSMEWLLFFIFIEIIYDIWHSSLQTWGICRIYDVKKGNSAKAGRDLDRIMNLYLYAGPLLAGVNFVEILSYMGNFKDTQNFQFVSEFFSIIVELKYYISYSVIGSFFIFLAYYLLKVRALKKEGYQPSLYKNLVLINTAVLCITCGFIDDYAIVYLALNFSHAIQTFGIGYFSEKETFKKNLKLENKKYGTLITLGIFLIGLSFIGALEGSLDVAEEHFFVLVDHPDNLATVYLDRFNYLKNFPLILFLMQWRTIASIMHYWSDSFIWSLQKKTLTFQKEKKND